MALDLKKASRQQLERHIRAIAKDSSNVIITDHARVRMKARNVLDIEVVHCLQHGRIRIEPEEDIKTGHLVCRMECYGASRNFAVCAALSQGGPSVLVVTVIVK